MTFSAAAILALAIYLPIGIFFWLRGWLEERSPGKAEWLDIIGVACLVLIILFAACSGEEDVEYGRSGYYLDD
jgi:hypothetical protein